MGEDRELEALLERWRAASEQVEGTPGRDCLTSETLIALVDGELPDETRRRALEHLADCSFCVREAASLDRALRALEDPRRELDRLGGLAGRALAQLRLFVAPGRGAFTRRGALLPLAATAAWMECVLPPPAQARTRSWGYEEDDGTVETDPHAVHEVALHAGPLSDIEVLLGEENGGGITVSAPVPCEVQLTGPDGIARALEFERGDDRYYALAGRLPPGEYTLTFTEADPWS